jgi:ribosomal protein S12 methylthiotransferase accessory factor
MTLVRKVPFYNDEPKIYQYIGELKDSGDGKGTCGYGSDISREIAIKKCIGEAIERTCLQGYSNIPLLQSTTAAMPYSFVEPQRFRPYSADQLKLHSFERMRFTDDAAFQWTVGLNVLTNEEIWLPAQLVLCPYNFSSEPIIRFPSSNGAASGQSAIEARCKAVLEVFERDTFMCWYLSAAPAYSLDNHPLIRNEEIVKIHSIYERYNLDLRILLLHSHWSFPVVLAYIIDHTGVGPGLRCGIKCHPHLLAAIQGAIAEAQQMRPWLRDHMYLYGLRESMTNLDVIDSWSRALYWARPEQYKQLSHLWSSINNKKNINDPESSDSQSDLNWEKVWSSILSDIGQRSADLFVFDLTGNVGKKLGVNVVKAVIPQAHPLYTDERYPYLFSDNLKLAFDLFGPRWRFEETNNYNLDFPPHPFS